MPQFTISIDRVVDLIGLARDPKGGDGPMYRVRCPFCGEDGKYKMHINTAQNVYKCFHCGVGGGTLDLYARAALGMELVPGGKERGGNSRYVYAQLASALGMQKDMPKPVVKAPPRYNRATDDALDKAYSAVLAFSHFSLSEKQKENLRKRGLDDERIQINGYRSVDPDCTWIEEYPRESKQYKTLGLDAEAIKFAPLKRQTQQQRIGGYIVARELAKRGVSMNGVPGFFRLKGKWLFRLEPGMLIPTRNQSGQIVGVQARKDEGSLRYMTVSSKGLPDGVTEGISRVHFPLSNRKLNQKSQIHITEGPLKADVIAYLMDDPDAYFVAVQGVQNTKDLPVLFEEAVAAGISVAYNAFDMDKITNPHVAKASRDLRKMAKNNGLQLRLKLWDIGFAQAKWLELSGLCRYAKIDAPIRPGNIFSEVGEMALKLHEKGIAHSSYPDLNGKFTRHYWSDITKGLDDFLLWQKQKNGNKA